MERDAADLVGRLSRGRVLVVGDLIYDRHVWGEVRRVSPEAPIQVLDVEHQESSPGGAANVACKVAELGGKAVLAGVVGNDLEGKALLDAAEAIGVDCEPIVRDERPTTTKIRYIARGQQLLRVDNETRAPVSGETEMDLAEAVVTELPRCDAVIVEDYGKGALAPKVLEAALERAVELPVVVDPNGTDWSRYSGATVVTPNSHELELAARCEIGCDGDLAEAARAMLGESGARAIAVTRGKDGITIVTREGVEHVPTSPVEVYDVTGAGDAVAATFALALAGGMSMREAAEVANLAGDAIVRQIGIKRISRDMLAKAAAGRAGSGARKVVTREEAVREARRAQASRRKVVFTNGCFDLLHPGHVFLLERARSCGDILIVGLNSDESVRRIKGTGRPVQPEATRAQVLAALGSVDFVTIFDEDSVLPAVEAVRPDVLVKGGDYTEEEVVGATFVKSIGGRVELVPPVEGAGTSDIIARVKTDAVAANPEKREWRDE